ncbi:MAG: ATP-binding cassette domain-containing protein [Candidatus Micrarchaeota archaeon]
MPIIETSSLTKKFGNFTAVDGISLKINEGEIFGLLGPNGAGKTTTISMLCTILKPSAGNAKVNGFDISKSQDQVRKSIGIVFQDGSLDEELTAVENLEMHGRLYGMGREKIAERIREVLEVVELTDRKDDVVKSFSGGMRRRLEIGRGLMHFPKILFLDEPTIGLDPQTRIHIWEYIQKLNREHGVTIVLTTHYMEEADKLCSRIAIIDHAKIVLMGTPDEMKAKLNGRGIITISAPKAQLGALSKAIAGSKYVRKMQATEGQLNITVTDGKAAFPKILGVAAKKGIRIESIETHKPSLSDVFIHYTGRDMRHEEAAPSARMRMMMRRR